LLSKAYKTIKVEKDINTFWIMLSRLHQLNAFNNVLLQELEEVLDVAEKDPSVRCVVVTGDGDRAFSSGADLTMFQKATPAEAEEFARKGQKIFGKIEEMSKPVIAAINGFAIGGGLELALACDIRIAAEDTVLETPEVFIGLIPGWGGTQRLVRVVGLGKAKEMVMLGTRLKAAEALKAGLVHKVVPRDKLREEAMKIASKFCEGAPLALKYAKHALNFGTQVPLEVGLRLEAALMGLTFSTDDLKEGVEAFLSKRKAEFKCK